MRKELSQCNLWYIPQLHRKCLSPLMPYSVTLFKIYPNPEIIIRDPRGLNVRLSVSKQDYHLIHSSALHPLTCFLSQSYPIDRNKKHNSGIGIKIQHLLWIGCQCLVVGKLKHKILEGILVSTNALFLDYLGLFLNIIYNIIYFIVL